MMSLFGYAVFNRSLVELDVLQPRTIARTGEKRGIENVYNIKIMNKAQRAQTFVIEVSGLEGLHYEGKREVTAAEGEVFSLPVELSIDPDKLPSEHQ